MLHVYKDYLYTGQFKNNKKHGKGTMKFEPKPGRKWKEYKGEFKNDIIDGEGEMQLPLAPGKLGSSMMAS